jgi:hypothetical protein
VRYHLKEQRQAGLLPKNTKELFNLQHASLQNVVEQIFGVIKRKFKILGAYIEYSIDTQVHLVLALIGLYNFIRIAEGIQKGDDDGDEEVPQSQDQGDIDIVTKEEEQLSPKMATKRDQIAELM